MGVKGSSGDSHTEKAEKELAARLCAYTAKSEINKNLQVRIGEEGVEVNVATLTDMPDLLKWALSINDNALTLPLSISFSRAHGKVTTWLQQRSLSSRQMLTAPLRNVPNDTPTRCPHLRSPRWKYPITNCPANTENFTTSVNTANAWVWMENILGPTDAMSNIRPS